MIEEECVKCGYNKATMQYFGSKTKVSESETLADNIKVVAHTHLADKEVIEVTCVRCNYVWLEKPLDYKEEQGIANV